MANNTTAVSPTELLAEVNAQLQGLRTSVDDIFLLFNGIIVSLMQTGFACLEAGSVNAKNVTNIMMKNVMDLFICAICYWLVGYSLAYSGGNSLFGYTAWAGWNLPETRIAFWFFQFVFAATAATIISGAVAERCSYVAYIAYSAVISGFVYPVISHWAWYEEGWLATLGYKDFAGSGVVHAMAGVCSLVGAAFIGPRNGRFHNGSPVDMPGHSLPLVAIGGLLLMSGFLAFNGGSLGHASQDGDGALIARSVVSTVMGGAGGAVVALGSCRLGLCGPGAWGFSITLNGLLAGMVSICGGADNYTSGGALIAGALGSVVYLLLHFIVPWLKVDDPLEAVAVHLGGGLWGIMATPLFSSTGLLYGGATPEAAMLLWHNAVGALAILAWSAVTSVLLFGTLKLTGNLRVSYDQETEGLDIALHNESAYPSSGWSKSHPTISVEQTVPDTNGVFQNRAKYKMQHPLEFDNLGHVGDHADEHKRC